MLALRPGAAAGRALRLLEAFVLRLFVVLLRFVFAPVLRLTGALAFGVAPVFRFKGSGLLLFVRAFELPAASGRSVALRLSALRLLVVKLAFKFELMFPLAAAFEFEFAFAALAFLFVFLLRFGRF